MNIQDIKKQSKGYMEALTDLIAANDGTPNGETMGAVSIALGVGYLYTLDFTEEQILDIVKSMIEQIKDNLRGQSSTGQYSLKV